MKNYISINISYFLHKSRLSQDDFGSMFNLKKGLITNYVNNKALPKIETIQRICSYYEILIDDFINKDLSKEMPYSTTKDKFTLAKDEETNYLISPRYVERLEEIIVDKDKIIQMLEEKLGLHEKNKQA